MRLTAIALILACPVPALAQRLDVKVVDRRDNETEYTYLVPGQFSSYANSSANCAVNDTNVNCNGSTTTNGYTIPAQQVSYHVRGATFSLQLPDGRIAVVIAKASSQSISQVAQAITGVAASRL